MPCTWRPEPHVRLTTAGYVVSLGHAPEPRQSRTPVGGLGVPRKEPAQWPTAPRVGGALDSRPAMLGDGVSWSAVDAGPDDSFAGTVSDYEIVASRLHSVRLTGTVFDQGHWTDVVVED